MSLPSFYSSPSARFIRSLAAGLAVLALCCVAPAPLRAQADPAEPAASDTTRQQLQELRRANGSKVYGHVVGERGDSISFETIDGDVLNLRRRYVRIRPASGRIVDGEFWPADKHTTRLFFAPTGRTLKEGAGYGGLFVILPFAGYGATDDITLAGGVPFIGSLGDTPFWVAPKVRVVNRPGMQISTGVFAIHLPGWEDSYCERNCEDQGGSWNGIVYGVGTFGDDENAVHAGTGVMFGEENNVPVMLGGEARISRRNKLITENWLLPGEGAAASFGIRRMGERWTVDYGLMFLFSGDGGGSVPYVPILSFSYAFGNH